jgi:hypothetical protein
MNKPDLIYSALQEAIEAEVSNETFTLSCIFIEFLPDTVCLPDNVGSHCDDFDGSITFEWYDNPNKVLKVSINGEKGCHYAALIGGESYKGKFDFHLNLEIDEEFLKLIKLIK